MILHNVVTKVFHSKIFILLYLALLMVSCQKQLAQSIVFVKKGVPSDLEMYNIESRDSGYLEAEKEWSTLTAKKAIFGDEIVLKIDMSISDFDGTIKIIFGANTFSISNNSAENGIF